MNEENPGAVPAATPSPSDAKPEAKSEVVTETASPVSQPMVSTTQIEAAEAAAKAEEEKKKKSHKGLIIGLIVGFLVLAGGVIGALFAFGVFKGADPVTSAITKLFEGNKPAAIVLDGTVNILPADTTFIKDVELKINSSMKTDTFDNETTLSLKAGSAMGDIDVSVSDVYANGNEIFLKLDGGKSISQLISMVLGDQLSKSGLLDDGSGSSTSSTMAMISYILEAIDGKWIRVPLEDSYMDSIASSSNAMMECYNKTYEAFSTNKNKLTEFYKKNAFVSGSNENLEVAKKKNPIYKLEFDKEKLGNFVSDLDNAGIFKTIFENCSTGTYSSVSASQITEAIDQLPPIYVEIDGSSNFTRFYTKVSVSNQADATVDFSFDYPSTIKVQEPSEYTELENLFNGEL